MRQAINAFGRTEPHAPDLRWRLLDDVAEARADWGLTDRSLAVLRALLSFLPKGERTRLVVFPSNRTLRARLMGMPESTLRRHLARLVAAGLVERRASANGKRFRVGSTEGTAFGLDLAPFFAAGRAIRVRAEAAMRDRARRGELRALLRAALARAELSPDEVAAHHRALRRRLDVAALEARLQTLRAAPAPPNRDAAAAHCGRRTEPEPDPSSRPDDEAVVAAALHEVERFVGRPLASARVLVEVAPVAARAMQLREGWESACRTRGLAWGALALALILRRRDAVRHPDAYLRALLARAEAGRFDLMATLRRGSGGQGGERPRDLRGGVAPAGQGGSGTRGGGGERGGGGGLGQHGAQGPWRRPRRRRARRGGRHRPRCRERRRPGS